MFRRNQKSLVFVLVSTSVLAAGLSGRIAHGVGLIYVDGDPEFAGNVGPLSAFAIPGTSTDNLWGKRLGTVDGVPNTPNFGAGSSVWESLTSEDSPELVQLITGLTPGNNYDIYGVFWSDNDENWALKAGLSTNTYTTYTFAGNAGAHPHPDTVQAAPAALAQWDPAGLPPAGPLVQGVQLFTQRVTAPFSTATFLSDDPLVMLLGKAGTKMADENGNIEVFMNDLGVVTGAKRAWFDGVAYKPADNAPLTPVATLNLSTGQLSITNGTSIARDIKAIRLESTLSGALSGVNWNSISGSDANWSVTEPALPATPATTPYATNLVETGTTNITLSANGGVLNFGNVWNRNPFVQQLSIHLILADDTLAILTPQITGTAPIIGDFDSNGAIDLADYTVLLGAMHTNLNTPGSTAVSRYRAGDMTGDTLVNFLDFQAFRTAYDAFNGSGSFDAMTGSVPEPGSIALVLALLGLAWGTSRRRPSVLCAVLAFCLFWAGNAGTALAVNIKVDIDSTRTAAATTTGNPPFTQAGFTSWDFTTFPNTGQTTVIDGITFAMTAGTAGSGTTFVGANQSRLRLSGTVPNGGGGPQNDILGDFIFNEGADGREIVLTITGLPVGNYLMNSWHQDLGTTADATTVIVSDVGGGNLQTVATAVPWSATPISYFFDVTNAAVGKRITFRESTTGNRARLNGFTLETPIELTLRVYTISGQMEIVNEQGVSLDMNYYEIRSAAGSLERNLWTSLDDAEGGGGGADFNADGKVDAADYVVWRKSNGSQANYNLWRSQFGQLSNSIGSGWDEVPNSTDFILSELNLQSMKTFAPTNMVGLGPAFELGGVRDLQFYYAGPSDGALRRGIVKYITSASGSLAEGAVPEPATLGVLGIFAVLWSCNRRLGRAQP